MVIHAALQTYNPLQSGSTWTKLHILVNFRVRLVSKIVSTRQKSTR